MNEITPIPPRNNDQGSEHVPIYRFGPYAKLVYRGSDYQPVSANLAGHVLRRMDGSNLYEAFSHKQIAQMLAETDDPLVVHPSAYAPGAEKRHAGGAGLLSALTNQQQNVVVWKEKWCRHWIRLEARDPNIKRSDECMRLQMYLIAQELALEQHTEIKRTTYKSRKNRTERMPGPRTLRRWLREYEDAGYDPIVFVEKYPNTKPSPLDAQVQQILSTYARMYASDTQPQMNALYDNMVGAIEAENTRRSSLDMKSLSVPCLRTFQNRVNALPQSYIDLGRLGPEAAARKHAIVQRGVEAVRPLERVETDEWQVDSHVLQAHSEFWKKLPPKLKKQVKRIRLWATAIIDVASKCIVALRVHREPPSMKSAIMALELVTRDKTDIARRIGCRTPWDMCGTPETVAADSATWYTSAAFRVVVNDLGSTLFLPPAGKPAMRGTIERAFRTFGSKALQYFSGRTWGSIEKKGDYDSEAQASLTVDLTSEVLTRFVVDVYHNEPHAGLGGETPRNAWARLNAEHGVLPPPTGDRRRHIFGINSTRKVGREGIRFLGIHYQSHFIQKLRRDDPRVRYTIRVDRHDLGEISLRHGEGWVRVPAVYDEFKGMSIWTWMAACERHRLLNAENAKLARETLRKTKEWLQSQGQMARLEAELGSGFVTDEDFERFEKKLDHAVNLSEKNAAVPDDYEADWGPSPQFFDMMGIKPVEFIENSEAAKTAAAPVETGPPIPEIAEADDETDPEDDESYGSHFLNASEFDN
ncbi:Mu transposase C-terminal domain-containing protein (plasmid) [Ensifer adhaerens]|uniref:Mu transposase C-terminal domain-containing protein n=1 Tax=Ensifer adhaerens TaxID=106592 RepID=UPI0023A9CFE1|nr:Mu transposase C-terminal domain-containing protein [Ensifer adhaerens]WDZ79135.1 Mu transposase C-terminal domain-containing protein [Ensifer adhaerens]